VGREFPPVVLRSGYSGAPGDDFPAGIVDIFAARHGHKRRRILPHGGLNHCNPDKVAHPAVPDNAHKNVHLGDFVVHKQDTQTLLISTPMLVTTYTTCSYIINAEKGINLTPIVTNKCDPMISRLD